MSAWRGVVLTGKFTITNRLTLSKIFKLKLSVMLKFCGRLLTV